MNAEAQSSVMDQTNAQKVADFHARFGVKSGKLSDVTEMDQSEYSQLTRLRDSLIYEEYVELKQAFMDRDAVEIADALADLLYVTYGTAIAFGIDINAVFAEVHRSNMSKLDENGNPVLRDDGKILKGENYFRPNIAKVLGLAE